MSRPNVFFLVFPVLLGLFSFSTSSGWAVSQKEEVEDIRKKAEEVKEQHAQRDAVADISPAAQKEYEVFKDMVKSMMDIKAIIEQDSQMYYETMQSLPSLDLSSFLDLLRTATAAKFELLARLVDDIAGGVSRSAMMMLGDPKEKWTGSSEKEPVRSSRKFRTTTTTSSTSTTTSSSTTTTTTTTTTTSSTNPP